MDANLLVEWMSTFICLLFLYLPKLRFHLCIITSGALTPPLFQKEAINK
jgi:hypothetical protein